MTSGENENKLISAKYPLAPPCPILAYKKAMLAMRNKNRFDSIFILIKILRDLNSTRHLNKTNLSF
ncbi:hypothetical protein FC1_05980 [Flavobacterium columnare NBRC 100251 = ATCC 23463]|nr:hypothetical protein FC1_05980 [Flavobacterium columnare NBRC 100251 = ATCC 23463]